MTLRVMMIGAFDPAYTRHAVIREGLKAAGAEVQVLALSSRARTPHRIAHLLLNGPRQLGHDVILVPAFNQLTAPLVWGLSRLSRKPVVVDYLTGLVDTAEDRQANPQPNDTRQRIDRWNINHCITFTDTIAHRDYFAQSLGVDTQQMQVIPVGVRDGLLKAILPPPPDDVFRVQYVGAFIPFHGLEVVLEAAAMLQDDKRIQFELVGQGQTHAAISEQARDLPNVTLTPGYYAPPDLFTVLGRASAFLGVFGDTEKTRYVVPSKVFEFMPLGRPVITADSPAITEYFTPGDHLMTVPPSNPQTLAAAIHLLANSPSRCQQIADNGRVHIEAVFTPAQIGGHLLAILEEAVS